MKHFRRLSAITLLSALTIFAPGGARQARAEEPAPVATVLDVEGPVVCHARTETVFRPVKGGERLFAGALLRTGAQAMAHLQWRNGGDFKLLALSEIEVPEDEGVKLNAGSVWAKFQHKLLLPFYFQSPSATAVVRGTVLGVELRPEGGTHVAVLEGRVEVSGLHGGLHLMLVPGQGVTVSPFGQLGPVEPVTPRERGFVHRGPGPNADAGRHDDHGNHADREAARPGPPGRGPGREVRSGFDWLQHNRAADRLEAVRQDVRGYRVPHNDNVGFPRPFLPPGGADAQQQDDPPETPGAASPERAFPFGRRPEDDHHHGGAVAPIPCPPVNSTASTVTGLVCPPANPTQPRPVAGGPVNNPAPVPNPAPGSGTGSVH